MEQLSKDREIVEVNSVFEQPWWLDIVAPGKWQALEVKDKNNQCIGRLPYINTSFYGLPCCGLPVFTQQAGPWIKYDKGMKSVARLKRAKQVAEELIRLLAEKQSVNICFHSSYEYVLPFIWAGYNVEPKFSYVLEDLSDTELIYQGMEAKVRNLIKNAAKRVSVTDKVLADDLVRLMNDTYIKQKRKFPHSKALLNKIYNVSFERGAGKIFGAQDNETGEIVAVAFFLYDKNTCYYLLGGKSYERNIQGAQELLLWEGIKFAATVSREFDFEGSMIPGIERFFRGFGGRPRVYYRVWRGKVLFSILNWLRPKVKKLLGYK